MTLEPGTKITVASLPGQIAGAGAAPATATVGAGQSRQGQAADSGPEIRVPLPDFSKGSVDLDEILGEVERAFLNQALEHAGGVKRKAAGLLGITFRSIRYRLKKLGLEE